MKKSHKGKNKQKKKILNKANHQSKIETSTKNDFYLIKKAKQFWKASLDFWCKLRGTSQSIKKIETGSENQQSLPQRRQKNFKNQPKQQKKTKQQQNQCTIQQSEKLSINEIEENSKSPHAQVSSDKFLPQILLIGRAGVGKTRLFNSLSPDCVSGNGFQTIKLNDFVVVDTPSLELDEEIELREERISQFQTYLIENQNSVSTLAIVVNFERTDLMKQKLISLFKYFRKFSQKMVIIVTNWELSENKDADISHLKDSFKPFKCNILFVENCIEREKLIELLRDQVCQILNINLNDTIFEVYDEDNGQFQQHLKKIVEKIENSNASLNTLTNSNSNITSNKKKIKKLIN